MNKNDRLNFIKITEKLITPEKVARLFKNTQLLQKLPQSWQKKIMQNGAKKEPYIGFVVEPYSFFLAYEIIDEEKILKILPKDYELESISMFDDTQKHKCIIIGAFNVHTSVFWGNRVEIYVIAKNKKTGLTSWIILEYESNTISYDPKRGFTNPSTIHSILTTSCKGELMLDIVGKEHKNKIQVNANIKNGIYKKLDQKLWLEGNLSVDYGNQLNEIQTKPFGLIFDPEEVQEALYVDEKDIEIVENTFLNGLIAKNPFEICCFPFAQHFYTTSIPMKHNITNKNDLENEILKIIDKD